MKRRGERSIFIRNSHGTFRLTVDENSTVRCQRDGGIPRSRIHSQRDVVDRRLTEALIPVRLAAAVPACPQIGRSTKYLHRYSVHSMDESKVRI
jgi:hypothetical protein